MRNKIFSNRNVFILLHLAGWIIILIIPLYFFNPEWPARNTFTGKFYVNASIYGIIFYTNYFLLIPRLFMRKKVIAYLSGVILLVVLLYFLQKYVHNNFFVQSPVDKDFAEMIHKFNEKHNFSGPPFKGFFIYRFLLTSFSISGFSLGLRIAEKYSQQEKMKEQLVKENLKTELAFLKNQISPHFFFNTLNNIYAMIETKTGNAQEAILQLSKLMRYLLYESEQGKVDINRELEFMKNYIRLMALRLSEKVDLKVSLPEEEMDIMLPPLLFIPLIENAFKHGVSYSESCFIHIMLNIQDNVLTFECTNRIVKTGEMKEPFMGIGIDNVRKRLELLYGKQADLNIDQSNDMYKVNLIIKEIC